MKVIEVFNSKFGIPTDPDWFKKQSAEYVKNKLGYIYEDQNGYRQYVEFAISDEAFGKVWLSEVDVFMDSWCLIDHCVDIAAELIKEIRSSDLDFDVDGNMEKIFRVAVTLVDVVEDYFIRHHDVP
jgi:hypothetical protein